MSFRPLFKVEPHRQSTDEGHGLRDPVSFGADLLRLEQYYREEAARLAKEAKEARRCAAECRAWAGNLGREVRT